MVRRMPLTNWIRETWARGGCGGHVVFGLFLALLAWPFYLAWLPFDLLIGAFRKGGMVALDLETTGLSRERDEILSIAIVDEAGEKVMYELVKPTRHKTWRGAQAVNGISPQMVAGCRPFESFRLEVQRILDGAEGILFYNEDFDRPFLERAGVQFNRPTIDVMVEYAQRRHGGAWVKLTEAADELGIRFENAHDALADATATMRVYQKM